MLDLVSIGAEAIPPAGSFWSSSDDRSPMGTGVAIPVNLFGLRAQA
jgi:hypothetical protein